MKRLKIEAAALCRLIAEMARGSPGQRFLHRLHCVLLVGRGRSCYEVGAWYGTSPRTIERWVHAYASRGVSGLGDRQRTGGRLARIGRQQAVDLARDLALPPADFGYGGSKWTGEVLARHVAARYGVVLGPRQCQRLLRSLAFGSTRR
ncbi:MAG: helix-turn-helix domain containing protein [Burkholderiales bacterium]|nr:helix-turn-helix domain containing protein [Burkholderiales bacterium]